MSVVIMVAQLLLGLSILVILHELGHFVAARAFGIKVDKFYLFFDAWGISLFKFNYKGVEYGIGWLPLGGYVKIAGMIDESMDTDQMAGPPQPWEFRSKPAWQRLIVMLGGVTVNIILGIIIFWVLTIRNGETYIPNANIKYGVVPGKIGTKIGLKAGDKIVAINGKPVVKFDELISSKVLFGNTTLTVERDNNTLNLRVPADVYNDLADLGIGEFVTLRSPFAVDTVQKNSNAAKAGLLRGDSILAVNNTPIHFFDEFSAQMQANKGKPIQLEIKRNGATQQLNAQVGKDGILGFKRTMPYEPKSETINYGFIGSLPIGTSAALTTFGDDAKGITKMFRGEIKPTKAFMGPVGIATKFGGHVDWVRFWSLVGVLSMALALMNMLPIPALDGGHSLFLIIEMIKGKPLSDKFLERAQIVGFVILIGLMVFIYGNDIIRHVVKH